MTMQPNTPGHKAYVRFIESVGKQTDPVMMLLRAHLYSEGVLEEVIRIRLPHDVPPS